MPIEVTERTPIRDLCGVIANSSYSASERANACGAAAVGLAKRMLSEPSIFVDEGFMSNEAAYGNGTNTYLTNAQGLVGVLLPIVEVEGATFSDDEKASVLAASRTILDTLRKGNIQSVAFDLRPYVEVGDIRKAIGNRQFYASHGVAWSLSALTLLYTADILGKLKLGDLEDKVRTGIVFTYGQLLDLYKTDGVRAGWGWCTFSDRPDLYHTWSNAQTLGDVDDYILQPEGNDRLKGDQRRKRLEEELRRIAADKLAGKNSGTGSLGVYLACARWVYGELFGEDQGAIKEGIAGNSEESKIYYDLLCLESLVYMRADELLPQVLGESKERLKNKFGKKLQQSIDRLAELREKDWYSSDASTLLVPLPAAGPLELGGQSIPEPCLEPLALRAIAYGPQYLERGDFEEPLVESLTRHVDALGPNDVWDKTAPNFIICERTVEALVLLRSMFRKMEGESGERAKAIQLVLPADQAEVLTNAVLERLRPAVEDIVRSAIPKAAASGVEPKQVEAIVLRILREQRSPDEIDVATIVNAENYAELEKPEGLASILDGPIVKRSPEEMCKRMLIDLQAKTLIAILRSADPLRNEHLVPEDLSVTDQFAHALGLAVAAVLPRAITCYIQSVVEADPEPGQLSERFDHDAVAEQIKRAVLAYAAIEFAQKERLDVQKYVDDRLDGAPRKNS